ncbi:MAG: hypothetical protein PHH54_03850 [Candidatus Nanoarchaeia archaeon]|nr:hypothetical protein [Candidatus Nanoarchaeia archaeon]MDD5741093.1 hypothetical protein [Candidatus Nanoarchaeia archaeon]
MKKRIFGSGPKCFLIGLLLIFVVYFSENLLDIPKISISDSVSNIIFIIAIFLTILLAIWGFISLAVKDRGIKLVTDRAFAYFRHPIYAAFLDFFVFGLGFYLKSYIILIAGIILIFICGRLVDEEENYLIGKFGKRYKNYQKKTKKFIPGAY